MIKATTMDNIKVFPNILSASSLFSSPSFIDILVLPPTDMATQKAPNIVNKGIVTPKPDMARAPISLIDPIKALSTVLYKEVTIIDSIAGSEYFKSSLPIFSFFSSY